MPQSGSSGSATTGRILVVDDQAANVRVVGILLGRNGYDVLAATSGSEALAADGSEADPSPMPEARHSLRVLEISSMSAFSVPMSVVRSWFRCGGGAARIAATA